MRLTLAVVLLLCLAGPVGRGMGGAEEQTLPRGLVLQEGGAADAAALGVRLAAKRWPAAYGFGQIDRELEAAQALGVKLVVGWMWDNEGPVDATPADWPRVGDWGPNYADPQVRAKALQSIRDLAARYDGHPQIVAVMANVGLDGERRFCKRMGDECEAAYRAAGLTPTIWANFVVDVVATYADAFQKTPVLFHYSGFGFHSTEIGRDADVAVQAGLGLMSSGLYPAMCSGNSWGGQCNPLSPLMNDWQVPSVYPGVPLAMEQSLPYGPDQAAMAWLWAVTHGAWQIHAQAQTLQWSAGTEWRETAEYMLQHPEAALWVAWEPTQAKCAELGRPYYCPEVGNWSRNVITATYGVAEFSAAPGYMGWVARRAPVTLRTTVKGRATVIVWRPDGTREAWIQEGGETVTVDEGLVHRIEVRPEPVPTATPTHTRQPTSTATAAPTPTWTSTPWPTATPAPGAPAGWRVTGKIGPLRVDLEVRPFWE